MIDGHIDTIPLAGEDRWSHHPLAAEIDDGRIFGLGTSDMKGPIAAFIHGGGLLVEHRRELRGPVYFVASIAEEMTEGATLRQSFAGRELAWCVIAEPTGLTLATCQRGRAKVALEFHGESCHAANAWRGENAVDHAVDTARRVRELPPGSHPLLGKRDVNLIDIHSEPYPSISTIPNWCLARFDVRFLPGEAKQGLLDAFSSCIADGVRADVRYHRASWTTYVGEVYDVDDYAAAWETPRDHPLVAGASRPPGPSRRRTSSARTAATSPASGASRPSATARPTRARRTPSTSASRSTQLERAAVGYREIALALLGGAG